MTIHFFLHDKTIGERLPPIKSADKTSRSYRTAHWSYILIPHIFCRCGGI